MSTEQEQSLQDLHHIRSMMDRSSRFLSLSGLSGVAAGVCALIGGWLAFPYVMGRKDILINQELGIAQTFAHDPAIIFNTWVFWIAAGTLAAAVLSAFIFTFLKAKKSGDNLFSPAAWKVAWAVLVPLAAGGIFLLRLSTFGTFGLIAPGCLIFYGLALINAGRYTFSEIRYLGYTELLLGLIALTSVGYGFYYWLVGFGLLHIIYGLVMWFRHEKSRGGSA